MKTLNKSDLAFFANQLSFLIDSQMPLNQGLLHIQSSASKKLAKIISHLIKSLEEGKKLHESLEFFPNFFIYMIKAGEEAGNLGEVLKKLAEHYEKEVASEKEMSSLMIYPIFILFALGIVILITTIFLVPNFTMFFAEQAIELPFGTQVLIHITNFLKTNLFLAILIFIFLAYIFLRIEKNILDKALFILLKKQLIIAFSYKLSMALKIMLKAEVPILEVLAICKNMSSNVFYQKNLQEIYDSVEKGKNLGDCIEEAKIFHYNLIGMAKMGEISGFLTESIEKCALFLEKEQKQTTERTKKLIEPILTIAIGIVLFFIMLALMLPTFAIMEVL